VRAGPGELEVCSVAVKVHAPAYQFLDLLKAFLDKNTHGMLTAQAITRPKGIMEVEGDLVVFAERHRHTGLSILGAGFKTLPLADEQNASRGGQLNAGADTGDSAADDQKVDLLISFDGHSTPMIAAVADVRNGSIQPSKSLDFRFWIEG
jgi:hypothetical protein